MKVLDFYRKRSGELAHLKSVLAGLAWDQEVMMPRAGAEHRARQRAALAEVVHEKLTDPALVDALETLLPETLEPRGWAGVRELKRQVEKAVRVPKSLVAELASVTALAYEQWVRARAENDFPGFAPWLRRIVELKRREADCLNLFALRYDSLLDEFELGARASWIGDSFSVLRPALTRLLERIDGASASGEKLVLDGDYPTEEQRSFGMEVLSAMGFDWSAGRVDISPHPFCVGISPRDVRLTTRYTDRNFTRALFGMIHEAGHGLYEQGLDAEEYGLPTCEAVSLGIHESQSRLWENQVARSRPFWTHWYPRLKEVFPGRLDHFSLDRFLLAINRVEPTPIRVEADEVTYGLHIILRFEIECDLIGDRLDVESLPEVWSRKMEEYLGIRPRNDTEGVLQDTHWSQGLVGYFPTYLLGNLYAAQLMDRAREDLPRMDESLARGEMSELTGWLRDHVHRPGRTEDADGLIRRLTGEPMRTEPFLNYLDVKYSELYGL
jgi:carboxypeptidase Taq